MNARLTEYWRSLLDYRVKNAHYSALVGGDYASRSSCDNE